MHQTNVMADCAANYAAELGRRQEGWLISEGLHKKINPDGTMNDFYGATTVIKLSERDKARCRAMQQEVLALVPGMLVPVGPDTFHFTIHALSNPYNVPGGTNSAIQRDIIAREEAVIAELREIRALHGDKRLRLRMLGASTAGNDVVSLKLAPADTPDESLLVELFRRIERVCPLGKRYTPHITLAYFKPQAYPQAHVDRLYEGLRALSRTVHEDLILDVRDLVYQHHYSMDDFRDVVPANKLESDPEGGLGA
ncbi:hypothetical protein [Paenibacillus sp. 1P07SE]|uniref:hypothetical protein n=1 Tax=Paenibacillus sp. 1P07SE TaxID=3132209 RepID=UPI0039A66570